MPLFLPDHLSLFFPQDPALSFLSSLVFYLSAFVLHSFYCPIFVSTQSIFRQDRAPISHKSLKQDITHGHIWTPATDMTNHFLLGVCRPNYPVVMADISFLLFLFWPILELIQPVRFPLSNVAVVMSFSLKQVTTAPMQTELFAYALVVCVYLLSRS